MLEQNSFNNIYHYFETNPEHLVLNALFSALCNPIDLIRWNSVCSLGVIVPRLAEKKIEDARMVMRQFLWNLNDESGGIGWGAPESLAEIMCHSRQLRVEYLHMLLSYMRPDGEEILQDGNYLELPMLQRGLLWGMGRLAECHRQELIELDIADDVASYLDSGDLHVAGLAIWTLGMLKAKSTEENIATFRDNRNLISLFRRPSLEQVEIGQLAKEALQSMNSSVLS